MNPFLIRLNWAGIKREANFSPGALNEPVLFFSSKGVGEIMGGRGQRERVVATMGHLWRSREGSKIRLRQVKFGPE